MKKVFINAIVAKRYRIFYIPSRTITELFFKISVYTHTRAHIYPIVRTYIVSIFVYIQNTMLQLFSVDVWNHDLAINRMFASDILRKTIILHHKSTKVNLTIYLKVFRFSFNAFKFLAVATNE